MKRASDEQEHPDSNEQEVGRSVTRYNDDVPDGGATLIAPRQTPGAEVGGGASGRGTDERAAEVIATAESGSGSGMKECVVQLCMYDRDKREIFGAGSGTLISDLGHILTAAHVVMNPHTMKLFDGRSNCTVLVAKYVADDKPPVVTWHAQICSTDNALKQLVTRSSDPSKKDLKDLAVLKLNGNATCNQPPIVTGVQPVGFIVHEDNVITTGLHYLPCNATAAPKGGDAIRAFGYPVDDGTSGSMRLQCAETIVTGLADGFIKAAITNIAASGFSGGPMVNSTGEVVGVMSKDRKTRPWGCCCQCFVLSPIGWADRR